MLQFKDFQEVSTRTLPQDSRVELLKNMAMGLAGEAGEVVDVIKKHAFQGHDLDVQHLEEELGDVLFYLTNLATVAGLDMELIAEKNVEKLNKRYPNGFSKDASRNRLA